MTAQTPADRPGRALIPRGMVTLWLVLFAVWLVANSTFAPEVVLVGALIALVLAYVCASASMAWSLVRWTPRGAFHFLAYTGVFVVELVKANLSMMAYVWAPRIAIRPGIVRVRTRLTSPIGRLALCNSIALTPGSLVIDVVGDTLYIHWLDVRTTDVEAATAALAGPFERHLERVFG